MDTVGHRAAVFKRQGTELLWFPRFAVECSALPCLCTAEVQFGSRFFSTANRLVDAGAVEVEIVFVRDVALLWHPRRPQARRSKGELSGPTSVARAARENLPCFPDRRMPPARKRAHNPHTERGRDQVFIGV
jgi:hypothetical protein